MRIQILSQYYPPEISAASVRLEAMTREFVRRGHDVDVVTALPSYPQARILDGYRKRFTFKETLDGAVVRRVWSYPATGSGVGRMLNFASFATLSALPMACTPRPDIILVESPPLFVVIPAILDRLVRRRRYGVLVADLWPDTAIEMGMVPQPLMQRVLLWLERLAYRHAALIAPVTEGQVDTLRRVKQVPEDVIHLVRNGVDVELFAPGSPSAETMRTLRPNGERVIIFAGTLGYAQGLDVIIDAVPRVRATLSDVRFVFVGAGSDRDRIVARVESERVQGVEFLDPRPLGEIAELYKGATAGITSLRSSPVFDAARPSKIFPMMAAELPVIYSGRGEGARLVADTDAGVIAAPGDPDALATSIVGLLEDPDRMCRMGNNGRRMVVEQLSWAAIMSDFVDALERVVQP